MTIHVHACMYRPVRLRLEMVRIGQKWLEKFLGEAPFSAFPGEKKGYFLSNTEFVEILKHVEENGLTILS